MKHALALLIALAPALAQARPVGPSDNPGPWKNPKVQPVCQNLVDLDNIYVSHITKDKEKVMLMWARFSDPAMEARNRFCFKLEKGVTVTTVQRIGNYECVHIKERPSAAGCFWGKEFTPASKVPFPDVDWYLW